MRLLNKFCDDKSASGVDDGNGGGVEAFKLEGHYNIYNWDGKLTGGGECFYFEGNQYWLLRNDDRIQSGGTFTYDDTYFT